MRDLRIKLRVEIENEMRVFLESLNFEIEMRVSQKSDYHREEQSVHSCKILFCCKSEKALGQRFSRFMKFCCEFFTLFSTAAEEGMEV